MPPPMRLFRPDFRTTFRDLSEYDRGYKAGTLDKIYVTITSTVDGESLDEADTTHLVKKSLLTAPRPEQCYEVIMQAIWPQSSQLPIANPGGSYDAKQDATVTPPDDPVNADSANNAMQTPPSVDPSTPGSPGSSPSSLSQPSSSGSIDNNATQTPPSNDPPAPGPPVSSQPQPSSSGSGGYVASAQPILPLPVRGRGAPRGQIAPRGQGRGVHRGRGHRGGGHRGRGTAFAPVGLAVNLDFIQGINEFPMPSGRHMQRTYAFTELSAPGAETIILGPLPPPTLPSHVRLSTLPPGHPPQSYGPGAFPPNYNIPGASSGNSNSGTTSETTEQGASGSSTQPVVPSEQIPDSSENLKKRSRDDEGDEEETSRPSIRLRIEAPPQSSLPDGDDTTAHVAPVASSSTLAPSDNNEGSSNSSSSKKRTRDAEEDEEEAARPSTRTRQELPAVRPRYPSPTPSDRRIGRIIAPFGTSIRFNPRPSPEGDVRSSSSGSSPSGSSTLPVTPPDTPSASRSSQRIREQKAKGASKKA